MTDYTKLVEALRCGEYKPECGSSDCPYWSGIGCMDGQLMEDAAAAIEALQALLPKEGEWIDRYDEDDKPFFKRKYVCSACSHWNTYGKSKYCPKCGAKMEVQK